MALSLRTRVLWAPKAAAASTARPTFNEMKDNVDKTAEAMEHTNYRRIAKDGVYLFIDNFGAIRDMHRSYYAFQTYLRKKGKLEPRDMVGANQSDLKNLIHTYEMMGTRWIFFDIRKVYWMYVIMFALVCQGMYSVHNRRKEMLENEENLDFRRARLDQSYVEGVRDSVV